MITDIDTNKYEGHTPAPWHSYHTEDGGEEWYEIKCATKPLGFISVHDDNRNHAQLVADAQLTADAPLLLAEVKRLRLLFRELINDMSADEYIEWCDRSGCPDGLEVEAIE